MKRRGLRPCPRCARRRIIRARRSGDPSYGHPPGPATRRPSPLHVRNQCGDSSRWTERRTNGDPRRPHAPDRDGSEPSLPEVRGCGVLEGLPVGPALPVLELWAGAGSSPAPPSGTGTPSPDGPPALRSEEVGPDRGGKGGDKRGTWAVSEPLFRWVSTRPARQPSQDHRDYDGDHETGDHPPVDHGAPPGPQSSPWPCSFLAGHCELCSHHISAPRPRRVPTAHARSMNSSTEIPAIRMISLRVPRETSRVGWIGTVTIRPSAWA